MKNILILGDTWGITPSHMWTIDKSVSQWFEFQLMKKGHAVSNRAWGGNSNNYQLTQAEVYLDATAGTPRQVDLIIWFHSELVRDFIKNETDQFSAIGYDAVLEITAERMYKWASQIKQTHPTVQWAILGGHAPLHDSKKHLLDWADFRIDNLRARIAGQDIPASHAFEFLERGKGSLWDWPGISDNIIQRELAIKEQITAATSDTTKFYNQKHPAMEPMKLLAHEIMEHFKI
jgi:hypothetical protein